MEKCKVNIVATAESLCNPVEPTTIVVMACNVTKKKKESSSANPNAQRAGCVGLHLAKVTIKNALTILTAVTGSRVTKRTTEFPNAKLTVLMDGCAVAASTRIKSVQLMKTVVVTTAALKAKLQV